MLITIHLLTRSKIIKYIFLELFFILMQMSAEEKVVEFVPLLNFDDYEILNVYPYTIRRKSNHYEVKESINSNGYIHVQLNCKTYNKHKLIAKQFLPNPLNLPCIDHRNKNRADNHLSNLRWVTHSENNENRSSSKGVEYTYVDKIDDDSIVVNDYGNHKFEDYYYDGSVDKFYFWNGVQYRELHVNENTNGLRFVCMKDINNSNAKVCISKFKKLYGLV